MKADPFPENQILALNGGELPEGQMMAYKKPGACHKARFLAFGIYILKILIFCDQNIVRDICFSRREGKDKKARLTQTPYS